MATTTTTVTGQQSIPTELMPYFTGVGKVDDKNIDYVQKGLAFRKFFKQFELAKDVIVDEAEMKDGLLKIKLGYNEPKEIEGVKIDIK